MQKIFGIFNYSNLNKSDKISLNFNYFNLSSTLESNNTVNFWQTFGNTSLKNKINVLDSKWNLFWDNIHPDFDYKKYLPVVNKFIHSCGAYSINNSNKISPAQFPKFITLLNYINHPDDSHHHSFNKLINLRKALNNLIYNHPQFNSYTSDDLEKPAGTYDSYVFNLSTCDLFSHSMALNDFINALAMVSPYLRSKNIVYNLINNKNKPDKKLLNNYIKALDYYDKGAKITVQD